MASYSLSHKAEEDLFAIARYGQDKWGEEQAIRYVRELQTTCALLANHPGTGRATSTSRPDQRRLEVKSHVIFYRAGENGILVLRILHRSMLPSRHRF